MVNGPLNMIFYARDHALQRGDARCELGDRQRIEVLLDQERERFAGTRQILFGIHGVSVDRADSRGNNDAMDVPPIPSTMRAIDPGTPGGPEVLQIVERHVPSPGEGEVLITVAAAGVNRPKILPRMGAYPPPQ